MDGLEVSSGSPAFSNPINFGTLGPKISRSSSPIRGARGRVDVDRRDKARFAILTWRIRYLSTKAEQRTSNGGFADPTFTRSNDHDVVYPSDTGLFGRSSSARESWRWIGNATWDSLARFSDANSGTDLKRTHKRVLMRLDLAGRVDVLTGNDHSYPLQNEISRRVGRT